MAHEDTTHPNAKSRLLAEFQALGKPFRTVSRPYRSVVTIPFAVADVANGVGYLTLGEGAEFEAFGYGLGDMIDDGVGGQRRAGEADTNQSKSGKTNGGEDFAIDSVSATCVGFRFVQTPVAGLTNPFVAQAYAGKALVCDPGSLIMPPQVQSPFLLNNAIFEAVQSISSVAFVFDRGTEIPIGALDEIPEGGAKSFLHSNGEPHPSSRYRVPEGYIWRNAGQQDSDFIMRMRTRRSLVIPFTQITLPGGIAVTAPTAVLMDVAMRVHGTGFRPLSEN